MLYFMLFVICYVIYIKHHVTRCAKCYVISYLFIMNWWAMLYDGLRSLIKKILNAIYNGEFIKRYTYYFE